MKPDTKSESVAADKPDMMIDNNDDGNDDDGKSVFSGPARHTRTHSTICDGCNPDPQKDLTVVNDVRLSRFDFCPECEEVRVIIDN